MCLYTAPVFSQGQLVKHTKTGLVAVVHLESFGVVMVKAGGATYLFDPEELEPI